jgi:dCTP deaminase
MYDALTPAGWSGELFVLVRADAFPIQLAPGIAVSQVRLFDGASFLDPLESDFAIRRHGLLFSEDKVRIENPIRQGDEMYLSLKVGKCTGWECRGTNQVLDMSKVGYYSPEDFFEPIQTVNGTLKLRKGSFYILSTKERVMVPPYLSAELRAMDPRFGEFRSHAAGYIDPGWGWGNDGSICGRPITLELTLFETREVHDGEHIAHIRYEHMKQDPEMAYDEGGSNYSVQETAALAKFFKK